MLLTCANIDWVGGNGVSLGSAICAGVLVILLIGSTIVPEAKDLS